jgi:Na+/melibiose symporter-like transporter
MPQYFQAVRGANALGSGLRLLPLVGGLIAGALPASALVKALGAKATVIVGFVLLGAGSVLGTATATDSTTAFVSIWMAVLCAGSGLALTAATAASMSQLSKERSGIGSAVVQAFQKTAGPFGAAIMGSTLAAVYQSRLDLTGLTPAAASTARQSVAGGITIATQISSATFARSVRSAFVHGMDVSLFVSTGIAIFGVVAALAFLPGTRRSAPYRTQNRQNRSPRMPARSHRV